MRMPLERDDSSVGTGERLYQQNEGDRMEDL